MIIAFFGSMWIAGAAFLASPFILMGLAIASLFKKDEEEEE